MPYENSQKQKRSKLFYGSENAVGKGVEFMKNVHNKMDITFDHRAPSIVIKIPEYYNGYKDILKRGGRIRCITEITKENIAYCYGLLDIVSELRHLDGLKGGIAINEIEYMATTVLEQSQPLTEVIYSNIDEVVAQGQYIFDTLWKNSIPAYKKIEEIEEGVELHETKLIVDVDNIEVKETIEKLLKNSSEINISSSNHGLNYLRKNLSKTIDKIIDLKEKGMHKGINLLVNVDKDNIKIVQYLLHWKIHLRNSKSYSPIDFIVTDQSVIAIIKRKKQCYSKFTI